MKHFIIVAAAAFTMTFSLGVFFGVALMAEMAVSGDGDEQ